MLKFLYLENQLSALHIRQLAIYFKAKRKNKKEGGRCL